MTLQRICVAGLVSLAIAVTLTAQGGSKLSVTSAAVSVDQTTLFIEGTDFGAAPTVTPCTTAGV